MVGTLRFILALAVVATHLAASPALFHWGVFAVFGFYIISGYLMTQILCRTYHFDLRRFAVNRALRLYPQYWLVALLTLAVAWLSPEMSQFRRVWDSRGWGIQDVLGNLFIFPFEFYPPKFRIVPPAWSLAVEIVNYFMLWLFVARSRRNALVVVAIGVLYHAASLVAGAPWESRYSPWYAAALPFAVGALLFHFPLRSGGTWVAMIAAAAWIINLVACGFSTQLGGIAFDVYFYVNFALLVVLVASLMPSMNQQWRLDRILGDLSYPIFLTHWVVGYGVSALLFGTGRTGYDVLCAALPVIIALSVLLALVSGHWIEPWRDRVRDGRIRGVRPTELPP